MASIISPEPFLNTYPPPLASRHPPTHRGWRPALELHAPHGIVLRRSDVIRCGLIPFVAVLFGFGGGVTPPTSFCDVDHPPNPRSLGCLHVNPAGVGRAVAMKATSNEKTGSVTGVARARIRSATLSKRGAVRVEWQRHGPTEHLA